MCFAKSRQGKRRGSSNILCFKLTGVGVRGRVGIREGYLFGLFGEGLFWTGVQFFTYGLGCAVIVQCNIGVLMCFCFVFCVLYSYIIVSISVCVYLCECV